MLEKRKIPCPKNMEKKPNKLKASRRKEIIKTRAEINLTENSKTMVTINETKSLFFEKINKFDKLLRLTNYQYQG